MSDKIKLNYRAVSELSLIFSKLSSVEICKDGMTSDSALFFMQLAQIGHKADCYFKEKISEFLEMQENSAILSSIRSGSLSLPENFHLLDAPRKKEFSGLPCFSHLKEEEAISMLNNFSLRIDDIKKNFLEFDLHNSFNVRYLENIGLDFKSFCFITGLLQNQKA